MALEVLYEKDILGDSLGEIIKVRSTSLASPPLSDFALKLLFGFETNRSKIDEMIAKYADNWSIDRMPIVDRNIIRIGVYEMLFEETIPIRVSINEAVELAKLFGSEDSSKFVNGILGRIAKEMGVDQYDKGDR